MLRVALLTVLIISVALTAVRAVDEGMWTFDNPPRRQWKEKYNFEPAAEWLDHLRLSTVRLSEGAGGGTGSFVSPDGLVMTNQHVGRGQISKLSTPERDLIRNGFYAQTRAEELRCPDLEVNVLVSYEDVTSRVQGAVKAGSSDRDAAAARRAEMASIEKESTSATNLKSEVVTLYSGGEYWLYRFKRYTDVRLVFATEEQIAYYGGDYDNFTYPRYCLDVSFFRVYEDGRPAPTPHHLKWSAAGGAEGELVIVPGFPGSTARLLTAAQLRYQREVGNPLQMQIWNVRREALVRYAARGPEPARQASAQILGFANSIKRLTGQQEGLNNPRIFRKKEEDDEALRRAVAAKEEWQRAYAPAWAQIEAAYRDLPSMSKRIAFSNLTASRLGTLASQLVRYAEEMPKPNEQRYEEFRDARLPSLRVSLLSPAPIYPEMEEAILTAWLDEARRTLGPNDPFIRAALGDAEPQEVVKRAISETKLADVKARQALLEAGPEAILKSDDLLLKLARRVEPILRELRAWEEEKIKSVESSAGEKIAKARFAVYGKTLYPDANFNLRITYGTILGYEEDTTLVPFKTTFYGLYDRARSFDEKPPYNLPPRYREGKGALDLATPLDFVYTADTIGGNSGSPVVNRRGELVGINFDSNIQKLPNRYLYIDDKEGSRAVGVHSAAIVEALAKLYGASALVAEITRR